MHTYISPRARRYVCVLSLATFFPTDQFRVSRMTRKEFETIHQISYPRVLIVTVFRCHPHAISITVIAVYVKTTFLQNFYSKRIE